MKQRLCALMCGLVMMISAATPALAQEALDHDPRLEGYGNSNVMLEGSTSLSWLLLIFLGLLCVGVVFKNAKRTHLD